MLSVCLSVLVVQLTHRRPSFPATPLADPSTWVVVLASLHVSHLRDSVALVCVIVLVVVQLPHHRLSRPATPLADPSTWVPALVSLLVSHLRDSVTLVCV